MGGGDVFGVEGVEKAISRLLVKGGLGGSVLGVWSGDGGGYRKIELDVAEILRSKQVSKTLKSLEKK